LVVAQHRVDFRKQWNGLLAEAYSMGFSPYDGDCVVFIKSDRTQLRALLGDAIGLFLLARRFEGGRLQVDWVFEEKPTTRTITQAELTLLLEGATYTVKRRVPAWQKKPLP
jgi:hypothetical protein